MVEANDWQWHYSIIEKLDILIVCRQRTPTEGTKWKNKFADRSINKHVYTNVTEGCKTMQATGSCGGYLRKALPYSVSLPFLFLID